MRRAAPGDHEQRAAATRGRTAPRRRATRSGRAGRSCPDGEVVDGDGRESPVHEVDPGGVHVVGDGVAAWSGDSSSDGGDEHDASATISLRHQPLDAARVEADERQAAVAQLGDQRLRDHEPGDDEEDVDADVAARGEAEPACDRSTTPMASARSPSTSGRKEADDTRTSVRGDEGATPHRPRAPSRGHHPKVVKRLPPALRSGPAVAGQPDAAAARGMDLRRNVAQRRDAASRRARTCPGRPPRA